MKRHSLETLAKALRFFGVPARLESHEALYHDYTQDIETDAMVAELFGDVEDEREQTERKVCTCPAHTRLYLGHVYLAFTQGTDKFIGVYAPEDGGVLPAHLPEEGFTGANCSECGEPQYRTPSGDTCRQGHGGAPPAED